MAARKMKPRADLNPRAQDIALEVEQLKALPYFKLVEGAKQAQELNKNLKSLEDQPGIAVLRYFRRGEAICRQDEPGFTAFYILKSADLDALPAGLRDRLPGPPELRDVARDAEPAVRVSRSGAGAAHGGWWDRLKRVVAAPASPAAAVPMMCAGELFGEMSCLYRVPRAATVIAERDCYLVEMLRTVLDALYKNKAFEEHLNAIYRSRVLELHLRALPLFRDLDNAGYERLAQGVELCQLEPGRLICDEHDRPDELYLIRSGFVKVIRGSSALLGEPAVPDYAALAGALHAGSTQTAGARRKLWDALPAPVRALIQKTVAAGPVAPGSPGSLSPAERQEILDALNDLVKQPKLYSMIDAAATAETAAWEGEAKKLPAKPEAWSKHQEVRAFNRRLLVTLFPGAVLPHHAGAERTLALRSTTEPLIGEIGLVLNQPRSATCVAYDHPGEGKLIHGRVELAVVSRALFAEVLAASPPLRVQVERVIQERLEYSRWREAEPFWDAAAPVAMSQQFDELGLIQGQKLMLIDLERCTRCDQCVQACVDTHTPSWWSGLLPERWRGPTQDGRSRLFLDGPRLQVHKDGHLKDYLVPSTCRQCKDPVCLVGCPVGSIHKGSNGQIVIEDWCIGCTRCAQQCPYGSIQMHYVGIIPRASAAWRHCRAGRGWTGGAAPFYQDAAFRERYPGADPVLFEHAFQIDATAAKECRSFVLILESAARPQVWINSTALELAEVKGSALGQEKWNFEARLAMVSAAAPPLAHGEAPPRAVLRTGVNTIRVQATPTATGADLLLDLGLSGVTMPQVLPTADAGAAEAAEQLTVLKTAVVCDMCSDQLGQRPACVNACPHEAAMRICVTPDTFVDRLR